MNRCSQCGANLPDEARYCLQCGTPVQLEPTPPAAPPAQLDFYQPALAGGMFLGVLSTLPIISAGNCLCCMWILLGGGIAVFLLTKQRPGGISYGDGAFAGVLSGVVGAVVGTLLSIPVRLIQARIFGSQPEALERMMRDMPGWEELEGPMRDLMLRVASPEISVPTVVFTLFTNLIIYSLFAMIGGILAVAVLEKRKKPEQSARGV